MTDTNITIQEYDRKAVSLSDRYESADVKTLQNTLVLTFKKCKTILELGCGSGRDAAFLHARLPDIKIKITDGSREMLKKAAELHPELRESLAKYELPTSLESEKGKFEGIYSIAALMHLPENSISRSVKLIAGLLEKDGILFMSVCTSREEKKENDRRHFTLKSREWWIREIEEADLFLLSATDNTDGLNRDNTGWLNLTAINRKH